MPRRHRDESHDYLPGHASGCDLDASLPELFEEFIDDSLHLLSARTERKYRDDFRRFLEWLSAQGEPLTLRSLDRALLSRYITEQKERAPGKGRRRKLSSHTVHSYVRVIRTFARYLVGEGRYPRDPFYGSRNPMPYLGPRTKKMAAPADIEALIVGTEGRDPLSLRNRAIVVLDLDTALRTGELARLRVGDVHIEEQYVEVAEGAKWDNRRLVPVSRDAIVPLRRYLRTGRPDLTDVPESAVHADDPLFVARGGKPLKPNGIYQAICAAHQRGGGSGVLGLHSIRHLWVTWTMEHGMDRRVTQHLAGHDNPRTTEQYAQGVSLAVARAEHARASPLRMVRKQR